VLFRSPSYVANGVPFISVTNVGESTISFEDTKFISAEEHMQLSKRCSPKPGDVLLTKVGSIGRTAIIPKDAVEFSIFVSVALLKINRNLALPEYVNAYLNSSFALRQFERVVKGIGVPDLHLEDIAKTLIVFPKDKDVQKRLCADYYKAFESHAAKLREADVLLAGMDDVILARLGIGEIAVQSRVATAVSLKTLKADKNLGAEYYHPERLAVIRALEDDPNVMTMKLSEIVDFLRNTVMTANSGKPYLGLSGVLSNTGELSGAEEDAEGQAFEYSAGDVLYARLRLKLSILVDTFFS
jgi:hypothetical protein